MVYLDYEVFKIRYYDTQRKYNEILSEKEELFTRTQPNAIRYDTDKVSGGGGTNLFDEYLIAKEEKQIEQRLAECESLLIKRKKLLEAKEYELRVSKDTIDKIYTRRYLDKMRVNRIASMIGYSESQVYRILQIIEKSLKDAKKCE